MGIIYGIYIWNASIILKILEQAAQAACEGSLSP
jgi:hypothetical protein